MISIVLIAFITILYLQLRRNNYGVERNILLGISIFAIAQVMFVSKHFAYHYLIPLLSVSGITVILILKSLISSKKYKFIEVIVFLLLILVFINNFNKYRQITSKPKENFSESIKIINFIKDNYDNYLKVYYYRSTSLEYALNFGNGYSVNKYNAELETYFPDAYFYDIWGRNFSYWGRVMPLPKNDKIIFQGTPFEGKNAKYKPEGYVLDNVFNGNIETVYKLQGNMYQIKN